MKISNWFISLVALLLTFTTKNTHSQNYPVNPAYHLEERFGSLSPRYEPYSEGCPLPDFGFTDCAYPIIAQDGSIIDTLYPIIIEGEELDDLEEQMLAGDILYSSNNLSGAEQVYMSAANNYSPDNRVVNAYSKLLTIKRQAGTNAQGYEDLRQYYEAKKNNLSDTLLVKILDQLSALCLIEKGEYNQAISHFDNIVQQNPNTEEALYAEMDALVAALLASINGDTTLGKTSSQYFVKNENDYLNKLNKIWRKNFSKEEKIPSVPTEYTLYQNYPNPFNPQTRIRYGIPEGGLVELKVFDILGREIATLVNELKEPGFYEVNFNGSSLSSGVYIYRLQAGQHVSAMKMMFVK